MLNAGNLNYRWQLQAMTTTADTYGQQVRSYATYATVWGSKAMSNVKRNNTADNEQQSFKYKLNIRYRTDVNINDRVVDEADRAYRIEGIEELGLREGLRLHVIYQSPDEE